MKATEDLHNPCKQQQSTSTQKTDLPIEITNNNDVRAESLRVDVKQDYCGRGLKSNALKSSNC